MAPGPLRGNGWPPRFISITLFILTVLGFVLIRRTQPTRQLNIGVALLVLHFLLIAVIYGVGEFQGQDPSAAAESVRRVGTLFATTGIALYACLRVQTSKQRSIALGAIAIGLTFNCAVGLLQVYSPLDLSFFFEPPGFVRIRPDQVLGSATRLGLARSLGTSSHPIEFSVLTAAAVPLNTYFAAYARTRNVRILAALGACLALFALPTAISRSGVISLAAGLLIYMWAFKIRQIALAGIIIAPIFLTAFAFFPATLSALWSTIIGSNEDVSVQARISRYTDVSEAFHRHPFFGLGLGSSPYENYGSLDNQWLGRIVEGGLTGLASMLVLVVAAALATCASLRSARTAAERNQAYAMAAMFSAIMVSSFTFDLFAFQQATILLFVILGLLSTNFVMPCPR